MNEITINVLEAAILCLTQECKDLQTAAENSQDPEEKEVLIRDIQKMTEIKKGLVDLLNTYAY